MKKLFSTSFLLMIWILMPGPLRAEIPVRHDLKVSLYPDEHRFYAEDTVTLFGGPHRDVEFVLHGGLAPSCRTPGVRLAGGGAVTHTQVPLESYKVTLPAGQNQFVLEYGGVLHHPLEAYGKERARGFRETPGLISNQGVYLSGSSYWYPKFEEELLIFTLSVELPVKWNAVSQGVRTLHVSERHKASVRWVSLEPQDEIFLVAGVFTEYREPADGVEAMVFLRTPDEKLARKYLDATVRYVAMYAKLIGPYPYRKFALVENFWETGFGMPSFTLLGSKVIRLPFILHSSYPHEILHNWWGNSVFPDYESGNWAEGLTAYLSDHLIREQRGQGMEYRQASLQKYADYVEGARDFPLSEFRSRHSASSEAIGYGKSLMFFHMLRQELGDEAFTRALQHIYDRNKFRSAGFEDLQKSFESVSKKTMKAGFEQWVTRTGAPMITVSAAKAGVKGEGYLLTARLEQIQPEDAYRLQVPVAVTMEGRDRAYQTFVTMKKRRLEMKLTLPARPLRLDVDPEFDLFRRLDRKEIPPALTQALGAKKMLILLPASSAKGLVQAYREFSEVLGRSGPDEVEIKLDSEVKQLPRDRSVTLLGWGNRFLPEIVSALSGYDVSIQPTYVVVGRTRIERENHSVVLTARHPMNEDLSLTWIAAGPPEALPGLGRKLPHYHKYSYLGFQGMEPENIAKGRWPVAESPMTVYLPLEGGTMPEVDMGKLEQRKPLAVLSPVFSRKRMMETIRFLSSDELGGRGFGTQGLDQAAAYIAGKFKEAGLIPAGDNETSYFQAWEDRGGDPERPVIMKNVVGVIPGAKPEYAGQSIVVGAHYDSLGLGWPDVKDENRGKVHPGADDNASGVSVLIELARVLARNPRPDRSVIFAAFTGEEAGKKGSKYFTVNRKQYPSEQCMAMLNIDTVGRLGKNRLLVLGSGSAREWVHVFRGAGFVTGVDLETVSGELDSSDQKSFQEAGIPAVQLFAGPHLDYHRPGDTADRIDPEGLLKTASVAMEVVDYLAGREEPLTATLKPGAADDPAPGKDRRVSLGTIPDFAYSGEGCRLGGVVPGAPAESCGLREGDIIVRIGSDPVHDLKDLSDILKSLMPGDRIPITFLREGREVTVEAEVAEK